ncbi:Aryl hydrocarbon receptor interacting [Paragonimus westermani]|uniref:Aryl hydrocarbon receptor interacting n=1 Tax=Paragonimus westermani TaxID=34504 RepID=A0A8T0D8E7_9TREM|nr:Aryl hydrocarbon receptor interacting [Paragonimus westermani]
MSKIIEKPKRSAHKHAGNCCQSELLTNLSTALKQWKQADTDDQVPTVRSAAVGAKNIEKRTLHAGTGSIPPGCEAPGGGLAYPKESKFIFHYQIRKVDSDQTILDDTRKYGKTMEIYSGKEFQLDFWEHCLGTMLPGEVASFTVPPERLRAFPAVNKKMRDYMLNKTGGAAKHCCGLMGFQEQGGLGYPDLDELMVKPETLEFIFQLIRVDIPGSVRKDTWIMNVEEKAKLVPVLREEGNQLYVRGDNEGAAAKYREALGLLEQLTLQEKPGEPEWVELDMARVPFFVNLAQCQFRLKQFYDVINSATEALSRDPTNVKALYRRAKAYTETWDLNLAADDLRNVAKLMPKMSETVASELKTLELKRSEQELKERRMLAGKLSARSSSHSTPRSDVNS